MLKFTLPAVAVLAMFCGSASVQAQPGRGPHHHHHHHHNHGSHYNGGYRPVYRPAYYPVVPVAPVYAAPVYQPSNYLGLRIGNFGLNVGSTPYQSGYGVPFQSGYGSPYRNSFYPR